MKTNKKQFWKNEKGEKRDNQRNSFRCYVLYFLYIKRESTKNDA